MSYEKQTWNNGDIITADKLNHMENGIGIAGSNSGSVLFVAEINFEYDEQSSWYELSTPFADIQQAYSDGKAIIVNVIMNGKCMYTFRDLSFMLSYDELIGIQCTVIRISTINNKIAMNYEEIVIASDGVTSNVANMILDGSISSK